MCKCAAFFLLLARKIKTTPFLVPTHTISCLTTTMDHAISGMAMVPNTSAVLASRSTTLPSLSAVHKHPLTATAQRILVDISDLISLVWCLPEGRSPPPARLEGAPPALRGDPLCKLESDPNSFVSSSIGIVRAPGSPL